MERFIERLASSQLPLLPLGQKGRSRGLRPYLCPNFYFVEKLVRRFICPRVVPPPLAGWDAERLALLQAVSQWVVDALHSIRWNTCPIVSIHLYCFCRHLVWRGVSVWQQRILVAQRPFQAAIKGVWVPDDSGMLAVIDAPIIETSALIVAPFTQITWTVAIRGLSTLNIRFAREIDASASVTLAQHRGHSCVAQACVYTLRVCFATPSDPSHIAGLNTFPSVDTVYQHRGHCGRWRSPR